MDKIIVTAIGLLGILFVYWYFLGKKVRPVAASAGEVDIVVDGGYSPDAIELEHGRPVKLNFLRRDPSSCLEEVVIPDLKIRRALPLNEKVTVEINPPQAGTYDVHCGMNMYHAKLIVR